MKTRVGLFGSLEDGGFCPPVRSLGELSGSDGIVTDFGRTVKTPNKIGLIAKYIIDSSHHANVQQIAMKAIINAKEAALRQLINATSNPVEKQKLEQKLKAGEFATFKTKDHLFEIKAIFKFLRDHYHYLNDPAGRERMGPAHVLARKYFESKDEFGGDCDEFTILAGAMCLALNHMVRIAIWKKPNPELTLTKLQKIAENPRLTERELHQIQEYPDRLSGEIKVDWFQISKTKQLRALAIKDFAKILKVQKLPENKFDALLSFLKPASWQHIFILAYARNAQKWIVLDPTEAKKPFGWFPQVGEMKVYSIHNNDDLGSTQLSGYDANKIVFGNYNLDNVMINSELDGFFNDLWKGVKEVGTKVWESTKQALPAAAAAAATAIPGVGPFVAPIAGQITNQLINGNKKSPQLEKMNKVIAEGGDPKEALKGMAVKAVAVPLVQKVGEAIPMVQQIAQQVMPDVMQNPQVQQGQVQNVQQLPVQQQQQVQQFNQQQAQYWQQQQPQVAAQATARSPYVQQSMPGSQPSQFVPMYQQQMQQQQYQQPIMYQQAYQQPYQGQYQPQYPPQYPAQYPPQYPPQYPQPMQNQQFMYPAQYQQAYQQVQPRQPQFSQPVQYQQAYGIQQ